MPISLDACLVRQCAPTLAGIKAGSLFCLDIDREILVCEIVAHWNRMLNTKNVFAKVVGEKRGLTYIYVYRPNLLNRVLLNGESQSFLKGYGYQKFDVESVLSHLRERFCVEASFPHEVGILLDYPLEDVREFIVNGGKNSKRIGVWKVYHNVPNSVQIFDVYRKCQRDMIARFQEGATLESLTMVS